MSPETTQTNDTRGSRRTILGTVTSTKMDKPAVITVIRRVRDRRFHKFVSRRVKYKAHDENNAAKVGDLVGRVLCHELRGDDGRVAIAKGRILDDADSRHALELSWSELHLLALADGDVHEDAAGDRIARLVAGDGIAVRPPSGGHWPLASRAEGRLLRPDPRCGTARDLPRLFPRCSATWP